MTALIMLSAPSAHAVQILSPNRAIYTNQSLAELNTDPTVANKTVVVDTHQVVSTVINWRTDANLEFRKGGYVTFTGSGALTGLPAAKPQYFGPAGGGTVNDTVAVQSAFNAGKVVDISDGSFAVNGVSVPNSVIEVRGNGTLLAYGNNATILTIPYNISRASTRTIHGISISGNGKTGVVGMQLGDTQAALYMHLEDISIAGCDTGVLSLVTMESAWKNISINGCNVGMKLYGDLTNGGQNANSYNALRIWNCNVGIILKTFANYGSSNNNFMDVTIQQAAICAFAAIGGYQIDTLSLTGIHIEGGFAGAATIVVDGVTIKKAAIYLVNASVLLNATQLPASLSPWLIGESGSMITYNGLAAYGSANGTLFSLDSTSFAYEMGANSVIGIKQIESYGAITSLSANGFTVNGAPKILIGLYENNSTMNNPAVPTLDNATGATTSTTTDSVMGAVSTITFAASPGNTSTNRNYWYSGAGSSGEYAMMSVLVKSNIDTSITFNCLRDGAYLNQTIQLKSGDWRRVVFAGVLNSNTGLQIYMYPTDSAGATLSFKGHEYLHTTNLSKINDAYQNGNVGVH